MSGNGGQIYQGARRGQVGEGQRQNQRLSPRESRSVEKTCDGEMVGIKAASVPWGNMRGWNVSIALVILALVVILSHQPVDASPRFYQASPPEGQASEKRAGFDGIPMNIVSLPDNMKNLDELFANANLDIEGLEAMQLLADLARADQVQRKQGKIQKLIRQKQKIAREARNEYLQLVDDMRTQRNEFERGGHPEVLRMLETLADRRRARSKRSPLPGIFSPEKEEPRPRSEDEPRKFSSLESNSHLRPGNDDVDDGSDQTETDWQPASGGLGPFVNANDQPWPIFAC